MGTDALGRVSSGVLEAPGGTLREGPCQLGGSNPSTQIADLASSCLMTAAPMFLCIPTTSKPPA
jgi:hypothetical protein